MTWDQNGSLTQVFRNLSSRELSKKISLKIDGKSDANIGYKRISSPMVNLYHSSLIRRWTENITRTQNLNMRWNFQSKPWYQMRITTSKQAFVYSSSAKSEFTRWY